MLDILIFTVLGVFVGLIAGLLPGIHPNQVFVILISLMPILSGFQTYSIIAFIISITVSNVVFNYIPSIFFTIPDPETVLSILPGHRMVLDGKGLEALFISLCGSFFTLIFCILTIPLLIKIIPVLNSVLYPFLHFLLLGLTFLMILLEKGFMNRLRFIFLYILSGFWGILTLNSVLIDSDAVLFPALSGMFGVAGLLFSLKETTKLPLQVRSTENIKTGNVRKIILSSFLAGLLIGVLPGAGESQAGVLISNVMKIEQKDFLGILCGINSSNMFFALVSLYSFGKIRSGSAAAINEVLSVFSTKELVFSIGVMFFSSGVSVLLTWFLGKKCLIFLEKINYRTISIIILLFTVCMIFITTGLVGIFTLIISTCIGSLPILWGIKRTSNMGYLMLSTTMYFAGLTWLINILIF